MRCDRPNGVLTLHPVREPSHGAVLRLPAPVADLVRELTGKLAEQTGLTMVWMERAHVLGERLALAAPDASQAQQDANPGPVAPRTTDNPVPFSGRLRVLAPWVLALLAIIAVVALVLVPRW